MNGLEKGGESPNWLMCRIADRLSDYSTYPLLQQPPFSRSQNALTYHAGEQTLARRASEGRLSRGLTANVPRLGYGLLNSTQRSAGGAVSNYGRSIVIAPALWSYSDAIAARADDTLPPPNFVILVADGKYLSCRSISQISQKIAHFQWKPPEKYRGSRGKLPFRLECRPAFDYAQATHQLQLSDHSARFDGPRLSLGLAAPMPLQPDGHGVVADFTLGEGESATFVLRLLRPEDLPKPCPGIGEAEELFRGTVEYWRRWLAKCTYTGRLREMVHRFAMTLKLLSFEPTGAIVAAPTCSLPESIGGPRN